MIKLSLLLSILTFVSNCTDSKKHLKPIDMDYNTAFRLAKNYAKNMHLDFEDRLVVHSEERFRCDFNSTDISFASTDTTLIVRSCVILLSDSIRKDLELILDELTQKYQNELSGAYFEYDTTAYELDDYYKYRLNLRIDFKDGNIQSDKFTDIVKKLHISAKRWVNQYWDETIKELNSKREQK
jgi:hypothetical protein